MRHCLHIPLKGQGNVHKGRQAKAHTVCYPGSALTSLPRNTSQWFLGPYVFYERDTGSWTKENKKAKVQSGLELKGCSVLQRGSWEIYKTDCSSSHCSVFCMQDFTNVQKPLYLSVLARKFVCVCFREGMCSVFFFCLFFFLSAV